MKLSNLLSFPQTRHQSGDVVMTTYGRREDVQDRDTEEYLNMLVAATSKEEVSMILTLLWSDAMSGQLKMDVGEFGEVLDTD